MINSCPCCGKSSFTEIFQNDNIPQYNLSYQKTLKEALDIPHVNVNFVTCNNCEFTFNKSYLQLDYLVEYNVNRSHSIVFNDYLNKIITKLLLNFPNEINNVVEIGASHCDFAIALLNEKPDLNYFAYDPSTTTSISLHKNLSFFKTYYSESSFNKPDLLILRHVLEHLSDIRKFMKSILHESPKYLFIEIPCFEFLEKNNSYNYHYFSNEHCSYFNTTSFKYFMNTFGYFPVYLDREFGGEYIVSFWEKKTENKLVVEDFITHSNLLDDTFISWKLKIRNQVLDNSIIWGGGGKGVMLSNILELNHQNTPFIIDLNKSIQGKYTPSNGIQVASPEILIDHNFTSVINLNPLYNDEIKNHISKLGLNTNVINLFN